MSARPELGFVTAMGDARAIGRALGQAGREAVQGILTRLPIWQSVTAAANFARVAVMGEALRTRFPRIHAELEGLAEGLGLPFAQVLAWNCRGDLLAAAPDGCTTVLLPGPEPVIGHNEDGLPQFRGHAFLADLRPEGEPGFMSFCYPGSIPGHTFAVTRAGIAQAVNNIRLTGVAPGILRMALGRAVLAARSRADAVALLREQNDSGGFHIVLGQTGAADLLSVEYGGDACSVILVGAPAAHANHALHLPAPQSVTRSSADRQARAEALLAQGIVDPLTILRDRGGAGLPIHRLEADDPDDENTLATALLRIGASGIAWQVHDQRSSAPVWSGFLSVP